MGSDLNYSQWKLDFCSMPELFSGKNVMIFYLGGKDSSVALDLVIKSWEGIWV